MSWEDEGEKPSLESPIETALLPPKPSLRYTREFLLSFRDLDVCKKLPSGFDESFLSEFDTAFNNESQRGVGGLPLQNSKRGDYGSVPNRLDSSSSYPRGGSGRWDTRSSGSSDRDGDLQSERETSMQESGRRFGNQARHFWRHQEHDGLLGSGAFPRPPGYAGASAPKGRGNEHYQLNRSTEPYQPPRPYKAVPHSRKEHTDSVNDETFGSTELSTQDRAEEEKRRRESFELMRKEQQKALKEKHKQIPENPVDVDVMALLDTSEEHKSKWNESKVEVSVPPSNSQSDSSRSSHIHVPPSRPLVPPGFASVMLEKTLCVEPSNNCIPEARTAVINNNSRLSYPDNAHEEVIQADSGARTIKHSVDFENDPGDTFNLQEANEIWESDNDLSNTKELRPEIVGTDQPSSILDKLFGSALSTNFSTLPTVVEHQGFKANENTKSPAEIESSKFAHWFLDEDKKAVEDFSSKNLLSLIINKEEVTPQVSEFSLDKARESIKPSLPFTNLESIHRHTEFPAAAPVTIPTPYHKSDSQETRLGVLTCEDLEQSILAEVKDNSSVLQQSVQGPWMQLDHELGGQKTTVDDHASEHLLSLLRKGTDSKESISPPGIDLMVSLTDRIDISGKAISDKADNADVKTPEKAQSSQKTLTLEALFGAAFMNELHSVEAPLSFQRGSVGESDVLQSLELHPPYENDILVSPAHGEVQPYKITTQGNAESITQTQQAKANKVPGLWHGGNDSSNLGLEHGVAADSKAAAVDIHLPEEDSLITVSDSLDRIASDPALLRVLNRNEEPIEQPSDSVLMAFLRNAEHAGQGHLPQPNFLDGPSGMVDPDKLHHHLHGRPSAQFPHPMNQVRPVFPPMEHHVNMNPQMRLIGSENVPPELQHPFPANVFPQHVLHSSDRPQFDPVGHHPVFQHMPIPGNLPPHHPHHGFPRGVPPSYSMNPMEGYMAEMNNMHGFPLNHRPPNFGGHGMGVQGPVIGSGGGGNPPLFNRLIEMELRANSKQIHPASSGQISGVYGPELDMGLRYR